VAVNTLNTVLVARCLSRAFTTEFGMRSLFCISSPLLSFLQFHLTFRAVLAIRSFDLSGLGSCWQDNHSGGAWYWLQETGPKLQVPEDFTCAENPGPVVALV